MQQLTNSVRGMMEKMDENQNAKSPQSDPHRWQPHRRGNSASPENRAQRPRPPVHRTQAQRELAKRRAEREAARALRAQGRQEREAKRRAQREADARKAAEKQARARAREEQYLAARGRLHDQVDSWRSGRNHSGAAEEYVRPEQEEYSPWAGDFDEFSASVERRAAGRKLRDAESRGETDPVGRGRTGEQYGSRGEYGVGDDGASRGEGEDGGAYEPGYVELAADQVHPQQTLDGADPYAADTGQAYTASGDGHSFTDGPEHLDDPAASGNPHSFADSPDDLDDPASTRPAFRRPQVVDPGDGQRPVIVVPRPVGWSRIMLVGIGAALISWLLPAVIAVIAFLLTASNSWVLNLDLSDAMVIGTDVWALSSFAVVAGSISLVPLGLSLINLLIAVLALRSTRVESLLTTAIFIPTYLLTSTLIGAFAHSHASLGSIAGGTGALAIGAWVVLNRRRLWEAADLWTRGRFTYPRHYVQQTYDDFFDAPSEHDDEDGAALPDAPPVLAHNRADPPVDLLPALRRGVTDAMVSLGGVAVVSAVALGISTWLNWRTIAGISELVVHSVSDAIMVWLGQLMYLPNALGWTAAWGGGPGFYLGTDTIHIPSRAPANPIPAVPMFGAVPGAPTGNWVVLVPIALGLVLGLWMMRRRQEGTLAEQLVHAVSTVVVFAAATGLWLWLSTGSLAPTRLSLLGPRWVLATLLLTAEVALIAATVYLLSFSRVRSYLGGRSYEASQQVRQRVAQTRKGGAGWLPWQDDSNAHEDGADFGSDTAPAHADPVVDAQSASSAAAGSSAETAAIPEVEEEQEENIEDVWKILDGGNLASPEAQEAGELAQAVPEEYLVEELEAFTGEAAEGEARGGDPAEGDADGGNTHGDNAEGGPAWGEEQALLDRDGEADTGQTAADLSDAAGHLETQLDGGDSDEVDSPQAQTDRER